MHVQIKPTKICNNSVQKHNFFIWRDTLTDKVFFGSWCRSGGHITFRDEKWPLFKAAYSKYSLSRHIIWKAARKIKMKIKERQWRLKKLREKHDLCSCRNKDEYINFSSARFTLSPPCFCASINILAEQHQRAAAAHSCLSRVAQFCLYLYLPSEDKDKTLPSTKAYLKAFTRSLRE